MRAAMPGVADAATRCYAAVISPADAPCRAPLRACAMLMLIRRERDAQRQRRRRYYAG